MQIDIGIPEAKRLAAVEALSRLLADTYTLYLKTHNFHWNVTGPQFNDLHAMFMEQYTEMWQAVDDIAERIRALGATAPGSYKAFAALTNIEESDGELSAQDMVKQLVDGHETLCRTARGAFPTAEKANDQVSLDLFDACEQHEQQKTVALHEHLVRGCAQLRLRTISSLSLYERHAALPHTPFERRHRFSDQRAVR